MASGSLRRVLFGERLPTHLAIHQRLQKILALPVFASDAISSSAYAVEEILHTLVLLAGAAALLHATWVAGGIALLFIIVAISYRQTIMAYPNGGGAYIVAKDNLGTLPGLIAAASLLTDYVLTVAVSISAGVAAIVSVWPLELVHHRVALCLLFIAIITLANLRGAKESGKLFAPPVYLFVGSVLLMVIIGGIRLLLHGAPTGLGAAMPGVPLTQLTQSITLLIFLRAFASGCAALTGIEAISNGIPAFRPPEAKNAATTLVWMTVICVVLFMGITILSQVFHIMPDMKLVPTETVLSKLGTAVYGRGFLYLILQASTAAILVLAANTSFADFPRLSSILARDKFAPRQLSNLGDRLVFANGILVLGIFSAVLVIAFHGITDRLIPLYAIGVFVSFTLSQSGMVIHWLRLQTPGWHMKVAVNAIGAFATAVVLIVVAAAKFSSGAWIVLLVIPLLVLVFRKINQHYEELATALTTRYNYEMPYSVRHAVLVLVPGVHRGVVKAVLYARALSPDFEAVHVEIDPKDTPSVLERWNELHLPVALTILKSPWRSLTEPLINYIHTIKAEKHVDLVTVILPEFATTRWWHRFLHNQTGLLLKIALMFEPDVVVVNVRYHISKEQEHKHRLTRG
jgi:amino acid transporter